MEIRRFFANKEDYNGEYITLGQEESWHLSKVLRLKQGFDVIVSLNDGFDYYGTIESIDKESSLIKINKVQKNDTETEKEIILCQALPKKEKLEITLQKAVELGISKFIIFISEYSQRYSLNIDRLKTIIKDAAKQCGRGKLMELICLDDFSSLSNYFKNYQLVCFFYEEERNNNINNISDKIKKASNTAIVIGSEGGFSKEEISNILKQNENVQVLTLGKRILRTETAAIVAMSLVLNESGELV